MSDLGSATETPAPAPAPKRRKVLDDSDEATPGFETPDEEAEKPSMNMSIRERPLDSRSTSQSRTPELRTQEYYSGRSTSRSRSRSSSRSRSRTRSRSRSRSESRSRSRSRSRSGSRSDSQSITRSRSPRSVEPTPLRTPHQHEGDAASPPPPPILQPNYQPRLVLGGHKKPIAQVRISPDGKWIASASADASLKIWEASTGKHMDTLVGHMAGLSAVAWSPDSKTLASGSDDKAIRLWDRISGRPARVRPLLGHQNYVYCLAFSPKGNILASGSYDEAVFLWDVRAGRLMRSLPAHSDPVSGIDFSRDGTLVVSCSTDGLTRIWDASTGQCLRTMVHEDNPPVTSVCFTPNGRYLLAFSMDSCIRLWDYVSGSVKKTYQGHENSAFSIGGCFGCVDGENAFVAAASEDGDIVLWDVKTKAIVQRIERAHDGVCFWVDVKGDTMVSCGRDGKIKVYQHRGPPAINGTTEPQTVVQELAPVENGDTEMIMNTSATPLKDEEEVGVEPEAEPEAEPEVDIKEEE